MNIDTGTGAEELGEALIVSELGYGAAHEKQETHQTTCSNCGAVLSGAYCHQCGQSAHIHRSLLHLIEEFLHGLLHFDTKSWRTLPALIFRPGQLTRNYINGQRTRYVSPLALFLFLIFLMFFVFSLTTSSQGDKASLINPDMTRQTLQQSVTELDKQISIVRQKLAGLESQNNASPQTTDAANDLKEEKSTLQKELVILEKIRNQQQAATDPAKNQDSGKSGQLSLILRDIAEETPTPVGQSGWLNHRLIHAAENPDLTLYKMKSAVSKFAFLLLPISLPFMWLLFAFRRQFRMFDHAVFSLYSLSFMALLMMLITTLSYAGLKSLAALLFVLLPPRHMFIQLRDAYGLTTGEALWRTCALLLVAFSSLLIYMLLIAGISM
ncbi:DUF3667 domain-containing protein [Undibacterium griseum]|uniref:DUF3667 domain-containing protein n=1 Tax=Undibacterium griseum TaxID=2762295 RepID=A0ABR6YN23_9BURK|nr:DUF3667 domain-containing protein [Undibacterium griseum]MBC3885304.1 DUF3667 domain-containing protein [Undibacterium griseum]